MRIKEKSETCKLRTGFMTIMAFFAVLVQNGQVVSDPTPIGVYDNRAILTGDE